VNPKHLANETIIHAAIMTLDIKKNTQYALVLQTPKKIQINSFTSSYHYQIEKNFAKKKILMASHNEILYAFYDGGSFKIEAFMVKEGKESMAITYEGKG